MARCAGGELGPEPGFACRVAVSPDCSRRCVGSIGANPATPVRRSSGLYVAGLPCDPQHGMTEPTTRQKALEINLDPTQYGTFAEIGAGQEVARWFFRVGGAAGTVAETVSAYDKQV